MCFTIWVGCWPSEVVFCWWYGFLFRVIWGLLVVFVIGFGARWPLFWMVFELVRDDLCTGLGKGVLKVNASYASCVCSKTLNSMWIPLVCGGGAHTVRDSLHTPETQDTFSFGKKEW